MQKNQHVLIVMTDKNQIQQIKMNVYLVKKLIMIRGRHVALIFVNLHQLIKLDIEKQMLLILVHKLEIRNVYVMIHVEVSDYITCMAIVVADL